MIFRLYTVTLYYTDNPDVYITGYTRLPDMVSGIITIYIIMIDIQSTRRFNVDVKNRPGPVPVNRFTQIGITDVNALSCKDVRLGKSRVTMGSPFGGYRANVAQKAQERSYQSSSKNLSYKPGTPLIVGSD